MNVSLVLRPGERRQLVAQRGLDRLSDPFEEDALQKGGALLRLRASGRRRACKAAAGAAGGLQPERGPAGIDGFDLIMIDVGTWRS